MLPAATGALWFRLNVNTDILFDAKDKATLIIKNFNLHLQCRVLVVCLKE